MRKILFVLTLWLFITIFPKISFASNNNQFINIVNPLRISSYTPDPADSINTQYKVIKDYNLAATWLMTDDVINNPKTINALKNFDSKQELGVFLEITPSFSQKSGVEYNKFDRWFRARSVFLIGYTQPDRIKLIDTIFSDFKEKFGYYPSSVGAWWIDSYSLSYMKSKYNITAYLNCSDQFMTDGYGIWGQYWSLPFYPSKFHSGIPSSDINNKLDITTIQWAPRDPLNGYIKGSKYSTQDYLTIGLKDDYYQKLINLYTQNKYNGFGQITIGLEGDFPADTYLSGFKRQMEIAMKTSQEGNVQIITMKQFSDWYRKQYPNLSPPMVVETDDLLGDKKKVIWYQSPYFRIGIVYDYNFNKTEVLDFRTYPAEIKEPYYTSPDGELNLYIRTPALIDSGNNEDEKWTVWNKKLESISGDSNRLTIKFSDNKIVELTSNNIKISKGLNLPVELTKSRFISIANDFGSVKITPKIKSVLPIDGLVFKKLTPEATNFLKQKKILVGLSAVVFGLILLAVFVYKIKIKRIFKISFLLFILLTIVGVTGVWIEKHSIIYFVSQDEVSALEHLSVKPSGSVVVYNDYCLQCSWHSQYTPAIFANHRDYVSKISKKPVIYNLSLFKAQTRKEAKSILNSLHAKYIYVARLENYQEKVPFSPGDLGIKLIYENANSQIWQVI